MPLSSDSVMPKLSPTTTGVGGDSTPKTTVHPVHWKDLDGSQGRLCAIESDDPCTLWGWDLLEEMGAVLTIDNKAF